MLAMFHKNERISAITMAGLFHICLGLCFIHGFKHSEISIIPQSIQVTLVAHSSTQKSMKQSFRTRLRQKLSSKSNFADKLALKSNIYGRNSRDVSK